MPTEKAAAWASTTLKNLSAAGITEQGKQRLCELLEISMNRVVVSKARKARQTAELARQTAEAAQYTAEAARQTAEAAQHTAEAARQGAEAELVAHKLLQTTNATEERPEEAEEKEAAEAEEAPKKRAKEPPFTEEEDEILLAELPIEKGKVTEIARSLAKLPELARRTEESIRRRIKIIEKNLENGLSLGGGQRAELTLGPGLEPAKAALRLSCHLAMLPTGGVVLPPGSLDSLYMARPADMAPAVKAPMFDEPTWLTGGKGERLGMILFEHLFHLQTKMVRQGKWGGPDLVAFDDTSSAQIAMQVEVKTVPANTQGLVRNTTAAIRIDRVRRKQSTVLLVVVYHEAGLDFFVRPTADFTARHETPAGRCVQRLAVSAHEEESALTGVLYKMLERYRHFASYRRQTHLTRLQFWEHTMAASASATAAAASTSTSAAAASASAPQWPLLAPMMSARPLPLLPPLPPLPSAACTDVLASERLSALERVANMSTSLVALSGMMHLPASQPGAALYMRFVDEMDRMPQHTLVLAFHGTPEPNVDPIGAHGLDPAMRVGDIRGHGDYFAESISMALPYMQGARRLLVFLLLVPSDGLCTPTGLVHRGDGGMIVMAKPSQQLPIATVDVTYVGLTCVSV